MEAQGMVTKKAAIKLLELQHKPRAGSQTPFSLTQVTISNWVFCELYKWEVTQTDWGDMKGAHPAVLQLLEGLHAPTTPPGVFSSEARIVNISLRIILFIFSRIYADKHDRHHSVPHSSDWHEDAIIFLVSVGNCNKSWLFISLELRSTFF